MGIRYTGRIEDAGKNGDKEIRWRGDGRINTFWMPDQVGMTEHTVCGQKLIIFFDYFFLRIFLLPGFTHRTTLWRFETFESMGIPWPHSLDRRVSHAHCHFRKDRSGWGIMARCRPSGVQSPVMPKRGSVRIERIAFWNLPIHPAFIVHEDDRNKFFDDDLLHQCLGRGKEVFLTMSYPDPEVLNRPAFEHDRGLSKILTVAQRRFQKRPEVFWKRTWALMVRIQPRHPSEKCKELATVAHAQRKGVGSTIEIVKHLLQLSLNRIAAAIPFALSGTSA